MHPYKHPLQLLQYSILNLFINTLLRVNDEWYIEGGKILTHSITEKQLQHPINQS